MSGQSPELPPPPPSPPAVLPWEKPGTPFFEGMFETIKLILSRPGEAYRQMPVTPDFGRPLLYAILLGWIGVIVSQLYSIAFRGALLPFLPTREAAAGFAIPIAFSIVAMIIAPVLVVIGLFVWSAIVHVFLMMLGGANAGFVATLRVLCYAATTNLFQLVPACGGLVGAVWNIVLQIIGLSVAHRTTTGKAAAAVLLPIAICCVCIAVVAAIFGAAFLSAISHAR